MKKHIDDTYKELIKKILKEGISKGDRTGTGTISIFGEQIKHKMSDGFPLLTIKKMAWKTMVTELRWFLNGDTNIKYLVDNGCNIWNGDSYKNYLSKITAEPLNQKDYISKIKSDKSFADKWGELGPIYGKQWRDFGGVDQISKLIKDLYNNPDSRRLMVSAWNPSELEDAVLPPCHYGFQIYTKELSEEERINILKSKHPKGGPHPYQISNDKRLLRIPKRSISLMWNQRSVDTPLGLPFNIASYGLLLIMIADEVNMYPDELIGNLGDCHIYNNQIEGVKELITRTSFPLPKVQVLDGIESFIGNDIKLIDYKSHSKLYLPLSN